MQVVDLPAELLREFEGAARKRLFCPRLTRALHGHHVRMAGVEQDPKIVIIDFVDDAQDIRGRVEGKARVCRTVKEVAELQEGEILVAPTTSPSWAPAFVKIKACVTDVGGVMSHAAIVCREYGLPAIVGTGSATKIIKSGQMIRVNGSTGEVELL